jgi:23S rRNA (cytosine1962-C5)-methyltransferase
MLYIGLLSTVIESLYFCKKNAMSSSQSITLKKGKEISLLRRHPWVFSGAIQSRSTNISDGNLVDVLRFDGLFLGKGFFQKEGSISVRMLTFENIPIDQTFWNDKVYNAAAYRKSIGLPNQQTNCYRLIHGEGDSLPGLIIDIYGCTAVIQCHHVGMYLAAKHISEALSQTFRDAITDIYLRQSDLHAHASDEDIKDRFLLGGDERTRVIENGIHFWVNVVSGQKTGFFLDQRENRMLAGQLSMGKRILNCFSYTGGFSLYALMGGATFVESVDISEKAVALLHENVVANDYEHNHQGHCANVMHFLSECPADVYDVIIVDPPAFAKSVHKRHNAVQAYKRLNQQAIKKVKSGGWLLTFSCSQVVGTQLFYDTIVAAGMESGRKIRVAQQLSQGKDHPVNLFHPEGHYLKGLLLYVED